MSNPNPNKWVVTEHAVEDLNRIALLEYEVERLRAILRDVVDQLTKGLS